MERPSHTSIFVAPLQIKKESSQLASVQPIEASEPTLSSPHLPLDPVESCEFQTYLRAFYPFHPICDKDSSTVTLPLGRGDIILVHSVHTNGWADGTLLSSGARGWLPTNYCEAYDIQPIRNLLNALTSFWDLVRCASEGALEVFGSQDYIRGLVAGVRCLLVSSSRSARAARAIHQHFANLSVQERTACLSRDSATLRSHSGLRWNRKALLHDVSCLVKSAKGLQTAVHQDSVVQIEDNILDELMMKAFRTVTRAVQFLDVWVEDILLARSTDNRIDNRKPSSADDRASMKPSAACSANETADDCPQEGTLEGASATSHHHHPANNHNHNVNSLNNAQEQTIVRPPASRTLYSHTRPLDSNVEQSCRQLSVSSHRQSVSLRVSCNLGNSQVSGATLASGKLSAAHDEFLGFLGSFIGLHLESRSSTDLLSTTKQAVLSCRDMLKIIEAVWERDARRSRSLAEAREDMYCSITDLAEAARRVFQPSASGEMDEIRELDAHKPMVDAATACVRAAGDCVAESQFVLERLGDFSFEPLNLDSSSLDTERQSPSYAAAYSDCQPQQADPEPRVDQHYVSVEPTNMPPCPPSEPPRPELSLALTIPATIYTSSPPKEVTVEEIMITSDLVAQPLLPPLPPFAGLLSPTEEVPASPQLSLHSCEFQSNQGRRLRTDSIGVSSATGSITLIGSTRDSEMSERSESSTRATSPDAFAYAPHLTVPPQCDKLAQSRSTLNDDIEEAEGVVQQKTFAHEAVYNQFGQLTGGTLPALIERLTTHDSTPDATFVAAFYLTFRLFAAPREFAQALIDRFTYVGDSPQVAGPVRLRVYNVFKGWLESHWRRDCDSPALELIVAFATRPLQLVLPTAGKRLVCLAGKVNAVEGPLVPRLLSSMGKTNTSVAAYFPPDTPLPAPIITKSQLAALKNWKQLGTCTSILDFDPLELARQLTIKTSRIFCSILPEELLATEWMKKTGSVAVNVRAMSTLSNDLASLVADCVLQLYSPKQRATLIKQWVKIADKCLELANYDSLMAIVCSLNSSTLLRLKRTWELVSSKTKTTLENLKAVVDTSRNFIVLRRRLHSAAPPCLPFIGFALTDLTFVEVGNPATKQLQGGGTGDRLSVINFGKHVKTAQIISSLQRFQVPYRLTEVPELQTWMQDQLVRVRSSDSSNIVNYYRRSLLLEPREQTQQKQPAMYAKDRVEMFWWPNTKSVPQWGTSINPS